MKMAILSILDMPGPAELFICSCTMYNHREFMT